ncbi:MAG: IS110 family transposase [Acidobacteria bacterium]|nr:IS110 family transposase [Acidobacteriota bacterium]
MKSIAKRGEKITMPVPACTVGLDVGDKLCQVCVLNGEGTVVRREAVAAHAKALAKWAVNYRGARVVLEVGTHSPWMSRLLAGLGVEVIVANARKLKLIGENERKTDERDAELLARLGRADPKLLYPIHHRGAEAQADLARLRARDALVRTRSLLINHVRGAVKSFGERLPAGSAEAFARKAEARLPEALRPALEPLLRQIAALTATIREYGRQIERLGQERYPETLRLRQVQGVGPVTALAFVLTLEDPRRFTRSRAVGPFLGLVSRQRQSSGSRPQLRITKTGDSFLRRLLVGSGHYILGPFAQPSALRMHGQNIALRGGKNAKKRAVVAVARKLGVLLHQLWISGATYEPLRGVPEKRAA